MKKYILISTAIMFLFYQKTSAQVSEPQGSQEVHVAGLDQYKNERTVGKALQLVGTLALGTYFVLDNIYTKRIEDGQLGAKRPPKALPIAGCAVMAMGFTIDIGAINRILKPRRTKRAIKVSTEDYEF